VLIACQRACLGITGVHLRRTYVRSCFELTLTYLVLARLIVYRKKRCIPWPFKLTSDLFLLVNNIRNRRICVNIKVRNCNLMLHVVLHTCRGDRVDQVQTIRQESSVWLWEDVQRVLKATFEIFCI